MDKFKFVVATRKTQEDFFTQTATGKSLALYNFLNIDVQLFPENKQGLPKVYNTVIDECKDDPCILIFAHDDLHIIDYYWLDKISTALDVFGVIGLAGNISRQPFQPSWLFTDDQFTIDKSENLSGVVGHGKGFPPDNLSVYGIPYQEVKLLDGLLIACKSDTLIKNNIRFDEIFDFHFYDLDLCRQLEKENIKMGTFDMSIIHESPGSFNDPRWIDAMNTYFKKWGS